MQPENSDQRLNLISTQWSLVYRAHQGPAEVVNSARHQLLERYGGAVRRYLLKVLRDSDGADEVFQEFALHLVHGDLRGANCQRGRFRDFVKGTLFHLIADYHKKRRKWPEPLPSDVAALFAYPDDVGADRDFVESWRDELLARAWAALAQIEEKTGQLWFTVLRFRADHADLPSPRIAEELSARLSRPFTAAGVRQMLHRAREKFAALLLEEVSHSVESPTVEQLEPELIELGLLDYCRPALERLGQESATA